MLNQYPNLMNLSRVSNPPKTSFDWAPAYIFKNYSYNFKWNQSYLSRGLNLNRGSNSLNSYSGVRCVLFLQFDSNLEIKNLWTYRVFFFYISSKTQKRKIMFIRSTTIVVKCANLLDETVKSTWPPPYHKPPPSQR